MKYIRLFLHMVRYKSALVLVLFTLLSVMIHGRSLVSLLSADTMFGALALVLIYVYATCINDIVDWKIDAVNLQGHTDRPLVTGEGSRKELGILLVCAAVAAVGFAAAVNAVVLAAVMVGLVLNAAYSVPPLRVSYRAILTPFYLAFCYVFIPYLTGYGIAANGDTTGFNWQYFAVFYLLFLARICLKDFRDRKGDALAGKPTLILKYGKRAVCAISIISFVAGGLELIILSNSELFLQGLTLLFMLSILVVEYRLYVTKTESFELLSIGYGARMGNGILFAVLGTFLLRAYSAATSDLLVFYCSLAGIYGWLFWQYVKHPDAFYFGKKKVTI